MPRRVKRRPVKNKTLALRTHQVKGGERMTADVAAMPFVFGFLEVREFEPGVVVHSVSGAEDCWTEYPESRGVLNSYSDSCSD